MMLDRSRTLIFIAGLLALSGPVRAFAGTAASFTLDGRLFEANSSVPLNDTVTFRVQILNGDKTCVLYEETQDRATSSGYFNLQVGSLNVNDPKRSGGDSHNPMSLVFQNSKPIPATGCASPYTPQPGEARYARITVIPQSTAIAQTMSPDLTLDSVPSAMVAETLQGSTPDDFIRADTIPELTQNAVEDLVKGDSLLYLRANANGASLPVFSSNPSSPAAGQMWFDSSGVIKFYNGSTVQTLGVSGTGITSLTAGTGLSGGTITTSGTIALASLHGTAGTALKTNYDVYGRVTGSTALTAADIPAVEYSTLLNANGLSPWPTACGAAQFLRWESTTDVFVCDSVSATQITTGLGYTPVNKAGDTMTGALTLPANGLVVGTNQLVTSGGKVGIGTTSPGYPLEVVATGTTPFRTFSTNTNWGAVIRGRNNSNTWPTAGPNAAGLLLENDAAEGGSAGRMIGVAMGNSVSGSIGFVGTKVTDSTNGYGDLVFGTRDATGSVERMRILSTGNVGIGTTVPDAKLDVYATGLAGSTGAVAEIAANSFDNLGSDPTLLKLLTPIGGTPRGKIFTASNNVKSFEISNTGAFVTASSGGYTQPMPVNGALTPYTLMATGLTSSSHFDGATPVVGNGVNVSITGWGGSTPGYRSVYGMPVKIRAANPSAPSYAFYADVAEGSKNWAFYGASGDMYVNGNVGIGTATPTNKLEVTGTVKATSFVGNSNNAGSATSIDWSLGNSQYTSADCGAITFTNMVDGGAYTLTLTGANAGTCSFSHAGLTFKYPPNHGITTAGTMTVYSFQRIGSMVMVAWITGY